MKRTLARFFAMLMILCTLLSVASANSWGLKGKLQNAVSSDHTWDSYSNIGKKTRRALWGCSLAWGQR